MDASQFVACTVGNGEEHTLLSTKHEVKCKNFLITLDNAVKFPCATRLLNYRIKGDRKLRFASLAIGCAKRYSTMAVWWVAVIFLR
jgi:hypothetical protein